MDNRDGLNVVVKEESLSLLRIEFQYLLYTPVVTVKYFIKSNQLINFITTYMTYIVPRKVQT
jgi:hypothetical protein